MIQSFSETALRGPSTFHVDPMDSLSTKVGKLIAGRTTYAVLAVAALVETVVFSAFVALTSPLYIFTSKYFSFLSQYTSSSANATLESIKGFSGFAKTVTIGELTPSFKKVPAENKKKTLLERISAFAGDLRSNPTPAIKVAAAVAAFAILYWYFSPTQENLSKGAAALKELEPICLWSEAPFPTVPLTNKILSSSFTLNHPIAPLRGTITSTSLPY